MIAPTQSNKVSAVAAGIHVSVILLNWNGKDDTLDCLKSLQDLSYPNYDIIVIDNGSTDDSVSAIKQGFPDIALIETGANLGFAEGNNVGIRHALKQNSDYILLLNNDTIVAPDILTAFIIAAEDNPNGGLFTAKMYYHSKPDTLWYAGATWDPDNSVFIHKGKGEKDDSAKYDTLIETDYACGCAIFIRTSILPKLGLMDKQFFLTYEETDWSFRARALGYSVLYVPQAVLWHKVSVSFGGPGSPLQSYFFARNRLLWAERHLSKKEYCSVLRYSMQEIFAWNVRRPGVNPLKNIYWNLSGSLRRVRKPNASPAIRAKYLGLRDYMLRRFGDCPTEVRQLARSARS